MKKYELTDETIQYGDRTLYRIRALRDFGNVREGQLGGFVEAERNLSQEGDCWIEGDAKVCGNARVFGNAWIYGDAEIFGEAQVFGNSEVSGRVQVFGHAQVFGNARLYGNAQIFGEAQVSGEAWVCDNAQIFEKARVYGNAEVYDNAQIFGKARVFGNAEVYDNAQIFGKARVFGVIHLKGTSMVNQPYASVVRSDGYEFVIVPNRDGVPMVNAGCRYFTLPEAKEHWKATRGGTPLGRETMYILEFLENILSLNSE